tara:strand:- start:241 stop:597 length:357 start_codon:yes stop_codon:yes gene_type:complete
MNKTKKIKDDYGNKKFISDDEYKAIRFIDNGGLPNKKLSKIENKFAIKEFKRHHLLIINWHIKKYKTIRATISKKIKTKNNVTLILKKISKLGWKNIQKISKLCLDYSSKRKTKKNKK